MTSYNVVRRKNTLSKLFIYIIFTRAVEWLKSNQNGDGCVNISFCFPRRSGRSVTDSAITVYGYEWFLIESISKPKAKKQYSTGRRCTPGISVLYNIYIFWKVIFCVMPTLNCIWLTYFVTAVHCFRYTKLIRAAHSPFTSCLFTLGWISNQNFCSQW